MTTQPDAKYLRTLEQSIATVEQQNDHLRAKLDRATAYTVWLRGKLNEARAQLRAEKVKNASRNSSSWFPSP